MEISKTTEESTFDTFGTPNNFAYSALEMDSLGATEYTLVGVCVDESSSIGSFETELNDALCAIIESCEKHPRSQNVLVRTTAFSSKSSVREIHGFSTLDVIDKGELRVRPGGMTPLLDATLETIETVESYAINLNDHDYFTNGILFLITDGFENSSQVATIAKIKNAVNNIHKNETMESITMILIGVNDTDVSLKQELTKFKDDAGFNDYISLGDATPSSLAKMAQWVSQSISSTSQALGSGSVSQACNFTL